MGRTPNGNRMRAVDLSGGAMRLRIVAQARGVAAYAHVVIGWAAGNVWGVSVVRRVLWGSEWGRVRRNLGLAWAFGGYALLTRGALLVAIFGRLVPSGRFCCRGAYIRTLGGLGLDLA